MYEKERDPVTLCHEWNKMEPK